jgi:CRP/FNR family transcriptional regulator
MGERLDIHNSEVPVLCRSCEARHKGMCGVLNPDELVTLSRHTHKKRHDAGTELVGEGSDVTSYANVMRGVVKLSKVLADGRQQVVGLQFAPDFVGRLYGQESAYSASAASEVELCVVPRGALERMVADKPALEHRLMQQTLRELDEARDWMLTLGRKTAEEKVASFLYLVACHAAPDRNEDAPAHFQLPLSRAEIADFLGLTIETVSRQLTRLRQLGTIRITNLRNVEIPNMAALQDRCG